ncbi:MAG: 3-oxoacyl-[acyl-carrier protein] reductase [Actinomycetota bacterium]|nr:3-oxoacyl-[acyl-carrier protein] reductase [Actinomycetota bacterium]
MVIAGRDPDRLSQAVRDAQADDLELHALRCDVTDEAAVDRLFAELAETHPPLGLCVNNAGRNSSHRLVGVRQDESGAREVRPYPVSQWEETIKLCLTGVFLVGRRAAAAMVAHDQGGVIVNISSATSSGAYGQSAYAAAKAGVESLTRTWAVELGEYGIRVVAVAPGVLDGEALRRRCASSPRHQEYMSRLRRQTPLGRWCTEQDVAAAVALAADNPSITGTVLEVHAGGIPRRVYE